MTDYSEGGAPGDFLPPMAGLWQQTLGWTPTPDQHHKFQQLYEQILSGNRQLNLTRITQPEEFWEKHLWDSLRGVFWKAEQGDGESREDGEDGERMALPSFIPSSPLQVIDIGSGAGFPGVPIAIVQPTWQITLLDSTRKKIEFVRSVLAELQISNAKTLSDRVEAIGHQVNHRAAYDLALLRAVAPASVCAEYALPLLKIGGTAVLYRGQWSDMETEQLTHATQELGGTIAAIQRFTTPLSESIRHCVYLHKVSPTPRIYPRPTGVPAQKPL